MFAATICCHSLSATSHTGAVRPAMRALFTRMSVWLDKSDSAAAAFTE
jgi:hypothetical protein